jgi:hypothetical protein
MQRKIRAGPTTQKHQKIFLPVPIAASQDSLTGYVLLAVIMAAGLSRKFETTLRADGP